MSKWEKINLSELAECLDSRRVPVKENERIEGAIPYYGANGQVGWIDRAIFNEPLLLIAEDGGHFDEPDRGVAYLISGPSWVNNHAHVLRAKSNRVMLEFLGYYFSHFNFLPYITGSTRQKLNQKDLFKVDIPLPPLAEQERIVSILDEAEEMKRLRAQANLCTADLSPALFDGMFGDPVRNTNGFPTYKLKQLGRVTTGTTPPSVMEGMFGGEIPFITPGDLEIDTSNPKRYVTTSGANESRVVRAGSTLVCCIGATIGKADIAKKSSAFNQQINAIEWNESVDDFYGLFCMRRFSYFIARLGGAFALPILKKSLFEEIEIPVPPIAVQKEFSTRVKEIRAFSLDQSATEQKLESLFQSLLHRAFAGEL